MEFIICLTVVHKCGPSPLMKSIISYVRNFFFISLNFQNQSTAGNVIEMVVSLFLCLFFALSLSLCDASEALRKKFEKTLTEKINFNRYVLAVPCRPLEIAMGYLNFQLVSQIGYCVMLILLLEYC